MVASVLNTPQAIETSLYVVRAFVRLRSLLATHLQLAKKLSKLEQRLTRHDEQIIAIVEAIKQLTAPAATPKRRQIGFGAQDKKKK